jgi:hypothetical protein
MPEKINEMKNQVESTNKSKEEAAKFMNPFSNNSLINFTHIESQRNTSQGEIVSSQNIEDLLNLVRFLMFILFSHFDCV